MKTLRNLALSTAAICVLFQSMTSLADILPPRRGHDGQKRIRCEQLPADANDAEKPDQARLDQFLANVAYKNASTPTITKLPDGQFKVCATFSR